MRWDELNRKEQQIATAIENIWLHNTYITKTEFLKALFFIGNKHKGKK